MTTAERLRFFQSDGQSIPAELAIKAADELDALTKERDRLRDALRYLAYFILPLGEKAVEHLDENRQREVWDLLENKEAALKI